MSLPGKAGTAPCGHSGFHLTANYVVCPTCDKTAVPESIEEPEDRITLRYCALCGNDDIEMWPDMMLDGRALYFCHKCNQTFT